MVHDYMSVCEGPACLGSPLTSRERQVLQLLAEGMTTKTIAWELSISPKTVDWCRNQLMRKLGITSIAGLVRYAIREGLTPLAAPNS